MRGKMREWRWSRWGGHRPTSPLPIRTPLSPCTTQLAPHHLWSRNERILGFFYNCFSFSSHTVAPATRAEDLYSTQSRSRGARAPATPRHGRVSHEQQRDRGRGHRGKRVGSEEEGLDLSGSARGRGRGAGGAAPGGDPARIGATRGQIPGTQGPIRSRPRQRCSGRRRIRQDDGHRAAARPRGAPSRVPSEGARQRARTRAAPPRSERGARGARA